MVFSEVHKWTQGVCMHDVSTGETPSELLAEAKEVRTGFNSHSNDAKYNQIVTEIMALFKLFHQTTFAGQQQ